MTIKQGEPASKSAGSEDPSALPQYNRTKIVATLGPASDSKEAIRDLVLAGADVFRINSAHATPEQVVEMIRLIRQVDRAMRVGIGILVDLEGPKIRVGPFQNAEPIWLRAGEKLVITTKKGFVGEVAKTGEITRIGTRYKNLAKDVEPDETILLDDGNIELKVLQVVGSEIETLVIHGGLLKQYKGINLPGSKVSSTSMTEKDLLNLEAATEAGADFLALSFVRTAVEVRQLKQRVQELGSDAWVIAKIERPEAIENLAEIIEAADALMVARGDLGVEMGAEVVPSLQKRIIRLAVQACKPVITATQMLESMITNPRPTRAEASDVANAIYDGSSAVMLSAETASGKYPLKSVQIMDRIIKQTEDDMFQDWLGGVRRRQQQVGSSITLATVRASVYAAMEAKAKLLAVFSESGSTALAVAAERSPTRVLVFTPFQRTVQRLSLVWGIRAIKVSRTRTSHEMTLEGERVLLEKGLAAAGDRVVVVVGSSRQQGMTNIMNIRVLQDPEGDGGGDSE